MADSERIEVLDVQFLGRPRAIAAGLIGSAAGRALVDPGPASSLEGLRRALRGHGLEVADIDTILLTHIHLDHAGATGTLVQENPRLRVYVHRRGARHLIDPARLVESARRLYGEAMDPLWGEMRPVPSANVHPLAGGEQVPVAGSVIEVLDTPGHATHHLTYFDRTSGVLFAGDAGGVHVGQGGYLLPPTPPPDIDVEAWLDSIEAMIARQPVTLFVTHFGLLDHAVPRLRSLAARLQFCADIVRESLVIGTTDGERIRHFVDAVTADLHRHVGKDEARLCEEIMSLEHCWHGLARYWRNRESAAEKRTD